MARRVSTTVPVLEVMDALHNLVELMLLRAELSGL